MSIRPASFTFTVLLAGMAALASLAIDMSLPALPILEREFHASAGQAGLTLSLFMAGFASGPSGFLVSARCCVRWRLPCGC
jgi:DHA1 family bicyclomycin/chloramphenicol resistance-like MFS transporter